MGGFVSCWMRPKPFFVRTWPLECRGLRSGPWLDSPALTNRPEKFTSVFSSGENTSRDDGCSLAVWTYGWLTYSITCALWDWKEWSECLHAFVFVFFFNVWILSLVKAAVSVCHRFYTIYQTSYSILKCFDHACNGVFISIIKMLFLISCLSGRGALMKWLKCSVSSAVFHLICPVWDFCFHPDELCHIHSIKKKKIHLKYHIQKNRTRDFVHG